MTLLINNLNQSLCNCIDIYLQVVQFRHLNGLYSKDVPRCHNHTK